MPERSSNTRSTTGLTTGRTTGLIAMMLILVGVVLRFYRIGEPVFWHDEIYTQIFVAGYQSSDWQEVLFSGHVLDVSELARFRIHNPARGLFATMSALAQDEPQHPPLYYLLARLWTSVFGNGVVALRSLSALISLTAFPALYVFVRELFLEPEGKKVAWTAVILLSVSPFFILYAQEAREYALFTVMVALSSAALMRAMRTGRQTDWGLYTVGTTLALYTSFGTAPVILAHIFYVLIRERVRWTTTVRWFGSSLFFVGLLFLPWALMLFEHFEAFRASMAWSADIQVPVLDLLSHLLVNVSRLWCDLGENAGSRANLVIAVPIFIFFLATLVTALRGHQERRVYLVFLLVVVPIAWYLIPDLLFGGIRSLSSRYLTPAWLGAIILAAYFLTQPSRQKPRAWMGVGLVLMAAVSAFSNSDREQLWTKSISNQVPEAAALINATEEPLLIANWERHYPGNLLALAQLLDPGTKIQVPESEEGYQLPAGFSNVFLLGPNPQFREHLENQDHVQCAPIIQDIHLELWKLR